VNDVTNLISQLEQQKASIDRAIEALREITNITAASKGPIRSASASNSDDSPEGGHITSAGRQKLAEAMKRRWAAKRAAARKAAKNGAEAKESSAATSGSPLKGRSLTTEQKRAISNAWTPERKQKFAEFHVQRMAKKRGENPAKALRAYRRRKEKEQEGTAAVATRQQAVAARRPARKPAVKTTATEIADKAEAAVVPAT